MDEVRLTVSDRDFLASFEAFLPDARRIVVLIPRTWRFYGSAKRMWSRQSNRTSALNVLTSAWDAGATHRLTTCWGMAVLDNKYSMECIEHDDGMDLIFTRPR